MDYNWKVTGRIITKEKFTELNFGWNRLTDILPPENEDILVTVLVFTHKSIVVGKALDSMTKEEKECIHKKFKDANKSVSEWGVNSVGTGEYKIFVTSSKFQYKDHFGEYLYIDCDNIEKTVSRILAWSKYPEPFKDIEFDEIKEIALKSKNEYIGLFSIDNLKIKYT